MASAQQLQSRTVSLFFCCLCLASLSAAAHGPGAHVHGVATLQIAVDGNTLTLNLESPLDNVLGFEHRAYTYQQKAAIHDMAERLKQTTKLFLPTPAAQCVPLSVNLESPVLGPPKADKEGDHADLNAEYVFRCENPAALIDIEVKLFDGFPRLQQLDVQAVSAHGQKAARLTPLQRHVDF